MSVVKQVDTGILANSSQSGFVPDLMVLRERFGPLVQLLPPGF